MLEVLAEVVEELDIPPGGASLAKVLALRDRLEAKVSTAVGAFDASGEWAGDGAVSTTAWLRHHGLRSSRDASATLRCARRLRDAPHTRGAWESGSLSSGQVQAVVANLSDAIAEQFAAQEEELVPLLGPLSVAEVAVAMRHWRAGAEALLDDGNAAEAPQELHCSRTMDGRRELKGHLDAEGGEILDTALRLATSPDVEGEEPRSAPHRRADALVDICRWFLDHRGAAPSTRRERPHVNVVIDLEDLVDKGPGKVLDGPFLDAEAIEAILCDAGVHRVLTAGRSSILDLGRTTRTIPVALWSALVIRDSHCRFSGCDRPSVWCEGHHVRHWSEGGETNLANLVLTCSRHHHLIHAPGWSAKLLPDATFEVTRPDGRVLTSHPPPRGSPLLR